MFVWVGLGERKDTLNFFLDVGTCLSGLVVKGGGFFTWRLKLTSACLVIKNRLRSLILWWEACLSRSCRRKRNWELLFEVWSLISKSVACKKRRTWENRRYQRECVGNLLLRMNSCLSSSCRKERTWKTLQNIYY